jgi:negative regulator of sigma E activity
MTEADRVVRLNRAAAAAKAAEGRGNDALAAQEWRRFRLIEDAGREAEDLLAEGIALSVAALALAESFA